MNGALTAFLERPTVYRLWQGPFVGTKLRLVKKHAGHVPSRRVLDVGCGPGTNAAEYREVDYLGLDINPDYIRYANRRHGDRFRVADVRTDPVPGDDEFDLILVNSLLHHLDDASVDAVLAKLATRLADGGHVHIVDLVLPERPWMARRLALWDRGDFPRPLDSWRALFSRHYEPEVFEPFAVPRRGPGLWTMVYFKGGPRT